MTTDLAPLRRRIEQLRADLEEAQEHLRLAEARCGHHLDEGFWSDPTASVNPRTGAKSWSRQCRVCGTEQTSTRSQQVLVDRPIFERWIR